MHRQPIRFRAPHPLGLLPSQAEMAAMDAATIAAGTAGIELMNRAGHAMAEVILSRLEALKKGGAKSDGELRTVVLCGPGNNGGDGFVVARLLREAGFAVSVVLTAAQRYSADLTAQALAWGAPFSLFGEAPGPAGSQSKPISRGECAALLAGGVVVVDALLGTGQREAPRDSIGDLLHLVQDIADLEYCIALDLPTGINGDTGQTYEPAFPADLTIAIELLERGMVQYPARERCGQLVVVSIGIDCSSGAEYSLIDSKIIRPLANRQADAHKGDFGNVLIIGGSREMPGAPALAAHAAARSGAGTVTKAHLDGTPFSDIPEVMLAQVTQQSRSGGYSAKSLPELSASLARAAAVVIGPGLGTSVEATEFITLLLATLGQQKTPTVLDADALNIIALRKLTLHTECVVTPHPGEMGRLLGVTTETIEADRYGAAAAATEKYGCTVVLKGAATVIRWPSSEIGSGSVNVRGTPALATGGSGDVLSGIIGAILAQGLAPSIAAQAGVLIHAVAGEIASESSGAPIVASDIISAIPAAISALARMDEGPCV